MRKPGCPTGLSTLSPARDRVIGGVCLESEHLGGLHFTGSKGTFDYLWKTIGKNISTYHQYPRIVGETGGKDFVMAHPSTNVDELATALVRGAFEYQGQKCSAASRACIPKSMWDDVR
ncbi:MAG: aldehyde dehydrogenase family protein [Bacteroidales bacterium]|nr:aldehyde dehydrogenase family protein [Bacteroidales bacterium]